MKRFSKYRGFCRVAFVGMILLSCQNATEIANAPIRLKETRGVRDILEDRAGNLWFSTPDYVARWDGESMHYFAEKEGLGVFGNLHQADHGGIWVENGMRFYRWDGERFSEVLLQELQSSEEFWIQRGWNLNEPVYEEPGAYLIGPQGVEFHPFPIPQDPNNKYLFYPTTKAHKSPDGTVWLGTMETVFGWKDSAFICVGRTKLKRQDDPREMGIRGLFFDSQNELWIADNGSGVFRFDGEQAERIAPRVDAEVEVENTLHRAFSIGEDVSGDLWFGTAASAIWKMDRRTGTLTFYGRDHGVMSNVIWTIYQTSDGQLLFGGESPGAVYAFKSGRFSRVF